MPRGLADFNFHDVPSVVETKSIKHKRHQVYYRLPIVEYVEKLCKVYVI